MDGRMEAAISYTFYCDRGNHQTRGMRGLLNDLKWSRAERMAASWRNSLKALRSVFRPLPLAADVALADGYVTSKVRSFLFQRRRAGTF